MGEKREMVLPKPLGRCLRVATILAVLFSAVSFAQGPTAHGVLLTWTAATQGSDTNAISGYDIYRETASGGFTQVGNQVSATVCNSSGQCSFLDVSTDLQLSTTYTYEIFTVDAIGDESGASNQASVTTPAAWPTNPGAPSGCAAKVQ